MSPTFRDKMGSLLGALFNTNDVITNTNEQTETSRKWNTESLAQNFYFRDPSADVGPRKGSSESDTKSSSSLLRSIFGSEDSESSSTYDSVGSFSGGGCGCGCGCGNDDLLPLLALAAAVLFLMMQGGGGRRKRSIEDKNIANDLSFQNIPVKAVFTNLSFTERIQEEARRFREKSDIKGSFSGHGGGYGGGYDQGCTYCAKIVWIGVAALAIQVVLMQQGAGGGGKKRKRRNTIDSEAIERLKEEFIADILDKPKMYEFPKEEDDFRSRMNGIGSYKGKYIPSML